MAGDWIPMRTDLADDPAVISIAMATKLSPDHVVGKLHRLWSWADKHTVDGILCGVPVEWVDGYVQKRGFAKAMAATPGAPWLVITPNGITVPRFERWNGRCAKSRLDNTRRAQMSREMRDNGATKTRLQNSTVQNRLIAPALGGEDWDWILPKAKQITEKLGPCGTARNKRLVLCSCVIGRDIGDDQWLDTAVRETQEAHPAKPYAYFQTVLTGTAEKIGVDFRGSLSAIELPVAKRPTIEFQEAEA